ncbi:MAG TPA: patatin-like phospholipase family protein [Gaiellaceae bacterium]|nr:patatin-like phospholipase family protein [Gaiellaceae bacterium]
MAALVKVLSIDGGGIRGVIPATVLSEIEKRTQARIASLFDLIAGTSTGGILALGLVKPSTADPGEPQYSASELVGLYKQEGRRIFDRSLWHRIVALDNLIDEKYEATGLEAVLSQYFGEAPLSKAVTEALVTSYELETREPWFFARHKALADPAFDFPMRFVARATSAAPTFFEPEELTTTSPHGGLVDGGVFANNPAMCAYVEAKKLWPDAELLVVSLGTGQHTRPIHYKDAKGWGLALWAKPILSVVFDGVSDTVDHQMSILCASRHGQPRYYRFQTELDIGSDDMDNATATNIAALEQKARVLISEHDQQLDTLCQALTASS